MADQDRRAGFIYAVQLREHVRSGEPIYKVGRASCVQKRFKCYPNGSALMACFQVLDTHAAEAALLRSLRDAKLSRTEFGSEYFEVPLTDLYATMATVAIDSAERAENNFRPVPSWRGRTGSYDKDNMSAAEGEAAPRTSAKDSKLSCEKLLELMATDTSIGTAFRERPPCALVDVVRDVEAYAASKRITCASITPSNVASKLARLYGCGIERARDGTAMVVFPGYTPDEETSEEDAPDEIARNDDAPSAGEQYVALQDKLATFVATKCVTDRSLKVGTKNLMDTFNSWLGPGVYGPVSSKWLSIEMLIKGFKHKNGYISGARVKCFYGLALRPSHDTIEDA